MSRVMKFMTCLLLASMVLAGSFTVTAAITCGTVTSTVAPCIGYIVQGGPISAACCTGVRNLNNMARTTPDRQQACNCLQNTAKSLGPGFNAGRVAGIPKACGVNIPYKISTSINCKTVR